MKSDQANQLRQAVELKRKQLIHILDEHGVDNINNLKNLTLTELQREVQFLREEKGVVIDEQEEESSFRKSEKRGL